MITRLVPRSQHCVDKTCLPKLTKITYEASRWKPCCELPFCSYQLDRRVCGSHVVHGDARGRERCYGTNYEHHAACGQDAEKHVASDCKGARGFAVHMFTYYRPLAVQLLKSAITLVENWQVNEVYWQRFVNNPHETGQKFVS